MSLFSLLSRWPLLRQLGSRADGTGVEAMSERTRTLEARTVGDGTRMARSVCPYCAVGCGQRVWHRDGALVAIDGDPHSPISQGTLCPKGSASFELLTHAGRLTRVLHRRPGGRSWEPMELNEAMDRVAELVWASRSRTWVDHDASSGSRVGHTSAVAHLGGATLDNEENYLIKKLFTGGLGMVSVSNQART